MEKQSVKYRGGSGSAALMGGRTRRVRRLSDWDEFVESARAGKNVTKEMINPDNFNPFNKKTIPESAAAAGLLGGAGVLAAPAALAGGLTAEDGERVGAAAGGGAGAHLGLAAGAGAAVPSMWITAKLLEKIEPKMSWSTFLPTAAAGIMGAALAPPAAGYMAGSYLGSKGGAKAQKAVTKAVSGKSEKKDKPKEDKEEKEDDMEEKKAGLRKAAMICRLKSLYKQAERDTTVDAGVGAVGGVIGGTALGKALAERYAPDDVKTRMVRPKAGPWGQPVSPGQRINPKWMVPKTTVKRSPLSLGLRAGGAIGGAAAGAMILPMLLEKMFGGE